jgi:predicted ArsR family transcriptional regulator
MKTTVSVYDFREAFRQAGRENFSYEALGLMFDYFEELEEDIGNEIELDVVAICCDYTEDDAVSIAGNYDIDITDMDEDEALEAVQDYLNNNTSVVGTTSTGSIVYADF